MLLALVLVACIAPAAQEWVEISQQNYRKPSHTHAGGTFYPADEEPNDDLRHTLYPANQDTIPIDEANFVIDRQDPRRPIYEAEQIIHNIPDRVYLNHSIDHKWNNVRGANIKRVNGNAKIRPNITPEFSLEIYGQVTEGEPEQAFINYSNRLNDKEVFSATIERVPNKGSVKRMQLSNTSVKAPSATKAINPVRRNNIRPYKSTVVDTDFIDEFEIKADILKNAEKDDVTPITHVKNLFSTTKESSMWKYNRIGTSTSEPAIAFQKYAPTHKLDNIKKVNNNVRQSGNIPNVKHSTVIEKKLYSDDHINKTVVKTKPEESSKEMINEEIPKIDKINKLEDIELEEVTTSTDPKYDSDKKSLFLKDHKTKPNTETSSKAANRTNEGIKVNTMENVMKFVKVVADTMTKNTKRGVNGKVKYLNELKETLLSSIKERIEATWPDDSGRAARRRSRSARGHVEFPSSESSLMTISFLTFAVFLIKLVLQVIQTYKNKAMMVAPVMVATAGRTISKLRNFH